MRADSLTDSHLAQLDASRLRKVHVDGVRFAVLRKASALKIGNSSLKRFSDVGNYPVLVLDRCSVTTEAVCRYTQVGQPRLPTRRPFQQWLEHLDSEETICTPVCTVKRCIYVDCNEFEAACRRRGLRFRHRRGSGSMTLYSVQNTRGHVGQPGCGVNENIFSATRCLCRLHRRRRTKTSPRRMISRYNKLSYVVVKMAGETTTTEVYPGLFTLRPPRPPTFG